MPYYIYHEPLNQATYAYDVEFALAFGFEEAVLIGFFQYSVIDINNLCNLILKCEMHKNKCEGKHWTGMDDYFFECNFPFWTVEKTKEVLNSLVKKDILISKKLKYRTLYKATDRLLHYLAYKLELKPYKIRTRDENILADFVSASQSESEKGPNSDQVEIFGNKYRDYLIKAK